MIFNQDNGKVYIGKTTNMQQRMGYHFDRLRLGNHTNKMMQDDYNNKVKNFCWVVLENDVDRNDASQKEILWMQKYKSYLSMYGYNSNDTYFWRSGKPTVLAKVGD